MQCARVREGLEPGLGDQLAAFLAPAVGPRVDPAQGLVDLAQGVLLVLDQAEGEFLVVVLGPDVGHVERDVGEVARGVGLAPAEGLVGHLVEVAAEPGPEAEQRLAERLQILGLQSIGHCDPIPS